MPYCCSNKLLSHPSHKLCGKSLSTHSEKGGVLASSLFLFLWPAVVPASPCWLWAKSLNHWIGGVSLSSFQNWLISSWPSVLPPPLFITHLPPFFFLWLVTSSPLSCTHNLSPVSFNPLSDFFPHLWLFPSKVTSVHMKCAKNESALTSLFLLVELNTLFQMQCGVMVCPVYLVWLTNGWNVYRGDLRQRMSLLWDNNKQRLFLGWPFQNVFLVTIYNSLRIWDVDMQKVFR